MLPRMSVEDLASLIKAQAKSQAWSFTLLDVREPEEFAIAHIEGSLHIPMGDIPNRLQDLDPDQEIIVLCHHGVRSAHVAMFLLQQDFSNVKNCTGGIDAWSLRVDPQTPRY